MTKLKNLLSEVFDEQPRVDKHEVIEGVKNYGRVGQSLFNNSNILEVAEQLTKVAESAHNHILGEQDDWFDKVSVNKNMGFLKGSVKEFKKTATEAHALNQRLQGLYEDIGHVLNRYYDIDEHVMTEDTGKDWDKDGIDEPDSEEYLDLKDKAIKANMGEGEQLDEIPYGGIPAKAVADILRNLKGQDGKTYIKDFPVGSPERAAEYERRNWAPDETVPVSEPVGTVKTEDSKTYNADSIPGYTTYNPDIDSGVKKFDALSPEKQSLAKQSYQDLLAKADDDTREKVAQLVGKKAIETGRPVTDIVGTVSRLTGEGVEESPDARLLRLAGITKEAVDANRPTKRLSDIEGPGLVTPGAVGGLNKKF